MKFEQYLKNIERLDQLIRLKKTGCPDSLASRLHLSRSTLYRYLDLMKSMGAPITYDLFRESFIYEYPVNFVMGFHETITREEHPFRLEATTF